MANVDIQQCIHKIRQDGYCILRGHFPVDAVEACQPAFEPIAEDYLTAFADKPNRGPNRHYIPLPFHLPFYHPAFFNDDTVYAIVAGILGEQMVIDQFASDTPYRGSAHQDVHADLQPLFPERPDLILPPELLAMNWPFVDVTPERGPYQIAVGTHQMPRAQALASIESEEVPLESLLMEVGDVMIRDPRCLHRGTPNMTDTPRVVAVVSFMRPWFCRRRSDTHTIGRTLWETLSEREQRLLQRIKIDESRQTYPLRWPHQERYAGRNLDEDAQVEPSDPTRFYRVEEYVGDVLQGRLCVKWTPVQVAYQLRQLAGQTRLSLVHIDQKTTEMRYTCLDFTILNHLAEDHASRLLAATYLAFYRWTGEPGRLPVVRRPLKRSRGRRQRLR